MTQWVVLQCLMYNPEGAILQRQAWVGGLILDTDCCQNKALTICLET